MDLNIEEIIHQLSVDGNNTKAKVRDALKNATVEDLRHLIDSIEVKIKMIFNEKSKNTSYAYFENGNILKVCIEDIKISYEVFNANEDNVDSGYTYKLDYERLKFSNVIDFVVVYCTPFGCDGEYEILE